MHPHGQRPRRPRAGDGQRRDGGDQGPRGEDQEIIKTLIEKFMVLKNDPDFEEHVCF